MAGKQNESTDHEAEELNALRRKMTRRGWLGAAGLGASGLLAGCSGGGDGGDGDGATPTPTSTPTGESDGTGTTAETTTKQTTAPSEVAHVSGQTFRASQPVNPKDRNFLATGHWLPSRYGERFAYNVWRFVHDHGGYGAWSNRAISQGEFNHTAYKEISVAEDEVSATLKDDAKWSNGDDILGRDAAPVILFWKSARSGRSFQDVREAPEGQTFTFGGITDAEWSGKTITFYQDQGRFPADNPQQVYNAMLCGYRVWAGFWHNTRIPPYDTFAETVFEHWERTKNGEINPWKNNDEYLRPKVKQAFKEAAPSGKDHTYWLEHQSKPENVVTSGAFQVDQINGTQSVDLTKNPHYHAADRVNFDTVKVVTRPSERANWSALSAETLDLYDRGTIPQHTADSFPDQYERRYQRANAGLVLELNHRTDEGGFFSDPRVRQAVMYALDTKRIAKGAHPTVHTPVTTPGAHAWGTDGYVSEEWVNDNLRDYSRDFQKAGELLREVGWTREGGSWMLPDGSPSELTIPTASQTPKMEPLVANQLSQFGIDTSLQTYSGSIFSEKKWNGEFDVWPGGRGVGWVNNAIIKYWWFLIANQAWTKLWNIFPNEEVQQVKYAIEKENQNGKFQPSIINPPTTENFSKVTVEAPEVGDWGGELKTWHPAGIAWDWEPSTEEKVKKLGWLMNWHMPVITISQQKQQQFLDAQHWIWPDKEFWEKNAVGAGTFQPEHMIAHGLVQADPDNPESGASVEE